jgi:periplasmic protein TonB
MLIDRLNDERHKLSSLCALIILTGVVSWAQSIKGPAEYLAQEAMELSIAFIEPMLPTPPRPIQPPVRPPLTLSKPDPSPVAPSTVEPIKEMVSPESPRTSATPAPIQTAPQTPAPQTMVPIEQPKAPPPIPNSVSFENNYIASIRATLNANKRYPTGREASLQRPSGKVKVWFVLLRNGSLQEAGIDESSNSIILDNAALSTVRRTTYVAWPDSSWPNQSQHKFTVTLDFVPSN